MQIFLLKETREPGSVVKANLARAGSVMLLNKGTEYAPGVEDSLIISMKGIAAGMQNTG